MPKRIILAVDDEPLVTRLVQVNLERAGYEVRTAQDGIEALEILRSGQTPFDLVLLDVTMPYMDGFELLHQMKADPSITDIPVVMMTARVLDADILHGKEHGAIGYLPKPVHPVELVNTVRQALGDTEEAETD
jgi:CheY-like chemotaxis protein